MRKAQMKTKHQTLEKEEPNSFPESFPIYETKPVKVNQKRKLKNGHAIFGQIENVGVGDEAIA